MALTYKQNRNFWGKEVGGANPNSVMWTGDYTDVARENVDPAFRNQQLQLAQQLMGQATGQGDSLAQEQLQQATDANIAQQRAMAASGRGANLGLAQKLAMTNAGQAQQQLAGQSAIARLQEQQGAQNMLGNVLGQGRSGDINVGQLGVQQRGQDIQNQQAMNQQELEWAKALKGQQEKQGGGVMGAIGGVLGGLGSIFGSDENLKDTEGTPRTTGDKIGDFLSKISSVAEASQKGYDNPYGAIGSLAGQGIKALQEPTVQTPNLMSQYITSQMPQQPLTLMPQSQFQQPQPQFYNPMSTNLMASDENLKKNIDQFVSAIKPHEYEYKNPEMDGEGTYYSPMAQELEKSKIGKSMVVETPRGKMVNYGRGLGVILAGQGYLNDRLDELEKKYKIKKG